MDRWIDGLMDRWIDGQMDGWTDKTDRQTYIHIGRVSGIE